MKDTYNYVTVQTDIRMPRRQFDVLADTVRQGAWQVKQLPWRHTISLKIARDRSGVGHDLRLRFGMWTRSI